MTFDIALIALAHGIPILVTKFRTNSKAKLAFVSGVMAVIAITAGSSKYTIPDLFVVGLVWLFCNNSIDSSNVSDEPKQIKNLSHKSNSDSDSFIGVASLIGVLIFFYSMFAEKSTPSPSSQPTQHGKIEVPMRDQKLLRPDALQAREATGQPSPIQKPKISSTTYDKPQRATETNLAGHLQTLASELNYASPKPFGEHLTLLHASVSGNSLSISMRINNHTAEDPAAQIALSNFNSGITAYYCESEPYGRLITQGATIIPTLYGKDSASIGAYPITISNCKK